MAQPATNPKIEELRFKLKTDPKSRLFYQLAEELRKVTLFGEAEQVLRTGLANNATYLSGWVSLGRVLREQKKDADAIDPLTKAMALDPGNVVVARLLAETYLALGEKVEAIKKYKLVFALMPGDQEVEAAIHRLEEELNPTVLAPPPPPEPPPPPPPPAPPESDSVFDVTYSKLKKEARTGDSEPMSAAHSQSPFEDTAGYGSDALAVEQPPGVHIEPAPAVAEVPTPVPPDEADVFEPIAPGFIQGTFEANVPPPPPSAEDFTKTLTMADLYANQGLIDDARSIYEDILARDPGNETVKAKLAALESAPAGAGEDPSAALSAGTGAPPNPKVARLETWLSKVKRV